MKSMAAVAVRTSMAAVLAGLITVSAWGQAATGTIVGNVTDATGAAVVSANVVATNTGTNESWKASTNARGEYVFAEMTPGMYAISVQAPGFRKTTVSEQRLIVASTLRINVGLEIGQVTEAITVDAAPPQVNTDDAQLGQALTNIPDLPLLSGAGGRSILNLVSLQPGISVTQPAGEASPSSVGPFSVNGQRTQSNNFMLDGADDNDLAINTPDASNVISPEAVGEFRVITGPMNAEYGRFSGAIIETTTKSGTNSFHGEAEDYFRNKVLNANDFFLNEAGSHRPQYSANDFDANVGGPIRRNKTFFFASYLGFRRAEGATSEGQVFSNAERAAVQANGVQVAKNLMALVPNANLGNDLWVGAPTDRFTRDQGLFRLDHRFSDSNNMFLSFFTERNLDNQPFAIFGAPLPGFGDLAANTFYNVTLGDTHTFSPTVINEATAAYHRLESPAGTPQNKTSPSSLGLTGTIPDDPGNAGPPFTFVGNINFGNTYQGPQARYDNQWQYRDSLTWVKGRHTFKFGGEYDAFEQAQTFDFIDSGYMVFDGEMTQFLGAPLLPGLGANDPAVNDFANGETIFYDQATSGNGGYRVKFLAGYAQDDFKIARNFTLNLGLRYDYGSPITDVYNRLNQFRAGEQSTVYPSAPVGLVFPGDPGVPRGTYPADKTEFQPRFGFAWDPTGNGKLSIRGGFGMFYNDPETELELQFLGAVPYGFQLGVQGVTDITHPYQTSLTPLAQSPFPFTPVHPGQPFNFANFAPLGLFFMDPHFVTPYSFQYDMQVQYQVARNWVATAAYVGSQGRHLENRQDINPALPTPTASAQDEPFRRVYNINNPQDAAYGGAVFGGLPDQQSNGRERYSSLQLSLNKNFSNGLFMTNSYTWSHCIDDTSGLRGDLASGNGSINPFNAQRDMGNCDTDVRQAYIGSVVYNLPFFKDQRGFLGHVLGGFTISSVVTIQGGIPFDIFDSGDRSLTGAGGDRPNYLGGAVQFVDPRSNAFYGATGNLNNFFDGVGGQSASGCNASGVCNPWFARVGSGPSVAQGAGYYGNMGRNVFHGPGILNTDLSVSKSIRVTESQSLTIRGQAFNFFNHAQFLNPDGNINDTTFGEVLADRNPRLIQLSLQYRF